MKMQNHTAKELFQHFKRKTENEIVLYSELKTLFPYTYFPEHAAHIWRISMLAECWGCIATKLSDGRVDYLKQWRQGE